MSEDEKNKLWALARAWRLAWADFDGRLLRSQIEDIIGDTPEDHTPEMESIREWMNGMMICTECGCWHDVCGCPNGG